MALTPMQVEQLRAAIDERREALAAELRRDVDRARSEQYGDIAGQVHDTGDDSVADLLADVNQADLSRDAQELGELAAALRRLGNGTYGTCADCGAEIPFERLRANPGALRCVTCQQLHENTFAQKTGSTL